MKIEAVIFDWAGTTVDYGCFAPVQAFIEVFKEFGMEVTMEETRKPMGMLKWDHIKTMLECLEFMIYGYRHMDVKWKIRILMKCMMLLLEN